MALAKTNWSRFFYSDCSWELSKCCQSSSDDKLILRKDLRCELKRSYACAQQLRTYHIFLRGLTQCQEVFLHESSLTFPTSPVKIKEREQYKNYKEHFDQIKSSIYKMYSSKNLSRSLLQESEQQHGNNSCRSNTKLNTWLRLFNKLV